VNDPNELKAALRKAAAVIQRLERQIEAAERAKSEPLAIVGVGCRLPGHVTDLESLARLLESGDDTASAIPPGRFDLRQLDDPHAAQRSGPCVEGGSFIDDVDGFDAEFWGISSREAAWLDPSHRLLLECAWEALEDARIVPSELRSTRVGVYVGTGANDYGTRAELGQNDPLDVFAARLGSSFAAGRLSFSLGLQGPAIAVETACSSSLVALHTACRALRNGECELALAGGAQVLTSADAFVVLSRMGALSRDGRCKSFSAAADGYGRADGCGLLVLERLSVAERAGHRVLGVIRGTAVNHDGPRSGLTTPNSTAQRAVLQQALDDARLTAVDIDYVEAHAIGTSLGDVIEVEAIAEVYGRGRREPLPIGSVKSNIGHLEPASGVAGVLKVLALLARGALLPNRSFGELNPELEWSTLPVRVVDGIEPWPRSKRPRRAGVSSFGLSGTNAHLVLEEAAEPAAGQAEGSTDGARPGRELVLLSAKTNAALNAGAERLSRHLDEHPDLSLRDVAYSLAVTRAAMDHRLVFVAATREELREGLEVALTGQTPRGVLRGENRGVPGRLGWMFRGQGQNLLGMGRSLAADWPAFERALSAACEVVDPLLATPLREVLWAAPGSGAAALLERPDVAQPACFALGWATAALWRSFGVEPDSVAGQAQGEITAACVAGIFSLSDAAALVCARGHLCRSWQTASGAAREATSPEATSPEAEAYTRVVRSIEYRAAAIPITSRTFGAADIASAAYWERQPWNRESFSPTLQALRAAKVENFLDLEPTEEPLGFGGSTTSESVAWLRYDRADSGALLEALGRWLIKGGSVNWAGVFPDGGRRVSLPRYAWQRQRHWIEVTRGAASRTGSNSA
jgi:acyl transferase domain-containing protein